MKLSSTIQAVNPSTRPTMDGHEYTIDVCLDAKGETFVGGSSRKITGTVTLVVPKAMLGEFSFNEVYEIEITAKPR